MKNTKTDELKVEILLNDDENVFIEEIDLIEAHMDELLKEIIMDAAND